MIRDGKVDVVQFCPFRQLGTNGQGEAGLPLHFALINQRMASSRSAQKDSAF